MVEKKTNFLLVVVAIVALVALILGAVALNKANMTGNAFWDFFKKSEKTQENVQKTTSDMANSIVTYGNNGEKVFEFINGEVTFHSASFEQQINNLENTAASLPGLSLSNSTNGTVEAAGQGAICLMSCRYAYDRCMYYIGNINEKCWNDYQCCLARCAVMGFSHGWSWSFD